MFRPAAHSAHGSLILLIISLTAKLGQQRRRAAIALLRAAILLRL
jgi:hypothetical protein